MGGPSLLSRRAALLGLAAAGGVPRGGLAATEGFEAIEARLGGRVGVAALDTGSGRAVLHRQDERFAMCSTFKATLAAAVLQRAQSGRLNLDDMATFARAEMLPNSPVTAAAADRRLSLRALCAAAVSYSDNTAANLLLKKLGGPRRLTAFFRSVGDHVSRLDRIEMALNENRPGDPRDTTTPAAMARTLRTLCLDGAVLGDAPRNLLRDWMLNERNGGRRIRSAAPEGWRVANKPGTSLNGAVNDIAVLWPDAGAPIVLSLYSNAPGAPLAASEQAIADTARLALRGLGHA